MPLVYRINPFSFKSFFSTEWDFASSSTTNVWNHKDVRPPRLHDFRTSYGRQKPNQSALHGHEGTPVFKTASAIYFSHARLAKKLLIWLEATAAIPLSDSSSFLIKVVCFTGTLHSLEAVL